MPEEPAASEIAKAKQLTKEQPPASTAEPGQPVSQPEPTVPHASARVYPEDLVNELSWFVQNGVAPEEGFEVTRVLAGLSAHREEAVPAIREFLEGGGDVRFGDVTGLNPDGTLRLALFDVLGRIGGADAEAALAAELQATAVPLEIATLAKMLDEQAPGEYQELAVEAARETLRLTEAGQLAAGDVGPLFEVLHDYGDAEVVPELQNKTEKWGHYAAIALGELPESAGIPALVERVDRRLGRDAGVPIESTAIYRDVDLFALQMLAQVAVKSPQAQEALIEQTAAGRIPDSLWPKLTQALGGVYLFQTTRRDVESIRAMDSESETYPHVRVENEQVLYVRNRVRADEFSSEERVERVAMIEEVLAVTKSPGAKRELENARDSLLKGQW